MNGRMFGRDTDCFEVVEAAIASLTARAALSLRREGLAARTAALSLSTDRHKPGFIWQQRAVKLTAPTADTGLLIARLVALAREFFGTGKLYHRANVYLYDLVAEDRLQPDLLGDVDIAGSETAVKRLRAVDDINRRFGKTTIRYAAEDLSDAWLPKHGRRSPRYTTDWQELPTVRPVGP